MLWSLEVNPDPMPKQVEVLYNECFTVMNVKGEPFPTPNTLRYHEIWHAKKPEFSVLNSLIFQSFTCMSCGSGFVEDVTIREDSPSSQSDDQSWGGLEAAFADTVEVNPLHSWHVQDKDKATLHRNLKNGISFLCLLLIFIHFWTYFYKLNNHSFQNMREQFWRNFLADFNIEKRWLETNTLMDIYW